MEFMSAYILTKSAVWSSLHLTSVISRLGFLVVSILHYLIVWSLVAVIAATSRLFWNLVPASFRLSVLHCMLVQHPALSDIPFTHTLLCGIQWLFLFRIFFKTRDALPCTPCFYEIAGNASIDEVATMWDKCYWCLSHEIFMFPSPVQKSSTCVVPSFRTNQIFASNFHNTQRSVHDFLEHTFRRFINSLSIPYFSHLTYLFHFLYTAISESVHTSKSGILWWYFYSSVVHISFLVCLVSSSCCLHFQSGTDVDFYRQLFSLLRIRELAWVPLTVTSFYFLSSFVWTIFFISLLI